MKRTYLLCVISLMAVFCGCQTAFYTLTNTEKMFPATTAENVKVTTNDKIEGEYTEVGYIFAQGTSVEGSINNLKEQAAAMGGTAVIRLQTTVLRNYVMFIPVDTYYCQGIVVKS